MQTLVRNQIAILHALLNQIVCSTSTSYGTGYLLAAVARLNFLRPQNATVLLRHLETNKYNKVIHN